MNHKHKVAKYSTSTSSGNLRYHLAAQHIEEWVPACDERKIPVQGGSKVDRLIYAFQNKGMAMPEPVDPRANVPEFSKAAFVDALVDFIVADDQVC